MLGQSHAVTAQKTPDRQRGESTNPNIFWNPVYCCAFVLLSSLSLSLLSLLFSALTHADVVLALFRAAASVASGNLGFSALLSAHSEVSVQRRPF